MPPPRHTRVTIAGQDVWLRPTEHRLLDILTAEPGRAFSRGELMERVMPGCVVLERTIDVHIKSLRKKLGPLRTSIQTVRRTGYRFVTATAIQ